MKLKASEIIKQSCCGQMLPVGCDKWKLARMVEELENEIAELKKQIDNIKER